MTDDEDVVHLGSSCKDALFRHSVTFGKPATVERDEIVTFRRRTIEKRLADPPPFR